jgi:hypothetical protein
MCNRLPTRDFYKQLFRLFGEHFNRTLDAEHFQAGVLQFEIQFPVCEKVQLCWGVLVGTLMPS